MIKAKLMGGVLPQGKGARGPGPSSFINQLLLDSVRQGLRP